MLLASDYGVPQNRERVIIIGTRHDLGLHPRHPEPLNLNHKITVDEAISLLDKYLDDAYMAHLPSVRVVHGKGTGALRSAVHNHLKRMRNVKEFRLGEYGEGDAGVTIVTFK